jgi:membrane-associated phospholipid phosphatase
VASSRVYVKIHHPSDVIAGALVGFALARLARRAWPFPSPPGSG